MNKDLQELIVTLQNTQEYTIDLEYNLDCANARYAELEKELREARQEIASMKTGLEPRLTAKEWELSVLPF